MAPATTVRDRGPVRAAWTLVLLTTLCAELTFTAVAVPQTWLLLPLLLAMYGAGVLLIRETVVRVGGGWPSLVVLGLAYQLTEDGLGLQALTSPRAYGAADWGVRALGVNWTYWESQIGVHVVLSVLVPITLLGILFPDLRGRPFLRRRGLVGVGVVAVAGVFGLRYLLSATLDPGYTTPWGATVALIVAVALLAVLALRVLPRRDRRPEPTRGPRTKPRRAPHPVVVGVVSTYLTMAFLTTLLPLGLGTDMLLGDVMSTPSMLVVGAMTAVPFGWLVVRWRAADDWDDHRRIWLIGGILVSHTAFMMPGSATAMIMGALTILGQVLLLVLLSRTVRRREATTEPVRVG